MKYCFILGTRPEIIKLSSLIREMEKRKLNFFIIHTNQHYNKRMDEIFFQELKLKPAKYNIGIGSGDHAEQTGKIMIKIERILKREKPNHIIVQGDTNTVVGGALSAAKEQLIKISHVEAGLRSYDRTMPEEINRIIADHISDYLFAPTKVQKEILIKEGIPRKCIYVVGNPIVDAVLQNLKIATREKYNFQPKKYFFLTLHRPANVDDKKTLKNILAGLEYVAKKYNLDIIFPMHPRTKKNLNKFRLQLPPRIKHIKTVGYLAMLYLMKEAKLIFTDSGGIQEEACILKIPCVTIRDNTERPETLEVGGNILAGRTVKGIISATQKMLTKKINWYNPFGSGDSAKKIIDLITR